MTDKQGKPMTDNLHSNWTIEGVLSGLAGARRVDDGGDLLACRVAGSTANRTVYVYLYGANPDLIHYDLEDESVETDE